MKKRLLSLALTLMMVLALSAPAFAAGKKTEITWLTQPGEPVQYNEELGWITLKDDNGFRVVDRRSGKRIELYDYVSDFCDGYAVVGKYTSGGIKYGVMDKNRRIVVPMEYAEIGHYTSVPGEGVLFRNGLIAVRRENADGVLKCGVVDATGKTVVPLEYDAVEIDRDNSQIAAILAARGESEDSLKITAYDKTGKIIIPEGRYDGMGLFFNGLMRVCKKDVDGNEKYGYVNTKGEEVIPPKYDIAGSFSEDGIAEVAIANGDSGWDEGYIDITGKFVIPLGKYDEIVSFYDGMAQVVKKDAAGNLKYGFVNTKGEEVIPPVYDAASSFVNGIGAVGRKNADGNCNWSYIDKTGKTVYTLKDSYASLWLCENGFARVSKAGSICNGYIDKTGKVVIPLKYTGYSLGLTENVASVYLDGKWGRFNTSGVELVPVAYDDVSSPSPWSDRGVFIVKNKMSDGSEKVGCYSLDGKLVFPVEYESIYAPYYQPEGKTYLLVAKKRLDNGIAKTGLFDSTGKVILPTEYDSVGILGNLVFVKQANRYGICDRP